ncbi:hypothetical protein B0T24DRAFT_327232 [Lasiosphaeria ovina]|uniref:Uncharacterized protein n=1 Tax=Lasiosphaeria ovina TaxID=92902 RepID=A0AAE0K8H9_9PEZI|nr:hypothetical protein B0T24DRAFT_327232 [Lasiosphaeria ovina]
MSLQSRPRTHTTRLCGELVPVGPPNQSDSVDLPSLSPLSRHLLLLLAPMFPSSHFSFCSSHPPSHDSAKKKKSIFCLVSSLSLVSPAAFGLRALASRVLSPAVSLNPRSKTSEGTRSLDKEVHTQGTTLLRGRNGTQRACRLCVDMYVGGRERNEHTAT